MSKNNWIPEEESKLAYYLSEKVIHKASGRSEDHCTHNFPKDLYFIGNLRPYRSENNNADDGYNELMSKLAPVAFGAEFILDNKRPVSISITVGWSCYYRVFPTYQQQCEYQRITYTPSDNVKDKQQDTTELLADIDDYEPDKLSPEVLETTQDRRLSRTKKDSMHIHFKKIACKTCATIQVNPSADGKDWVIDNKALRENINNEFQRAKRIILSDDNRIKVRANPEQKVLIPETALESESAFVKYIRSFDTEIAPDWRIDIKHEFSVENKDSYRFSLEFVNSSVGNDQSANTELYLFDTYAAFEFASEQVKPFIFEQIPTNFRYNKEMWGRGINCDIELVNTDEDGKDLYSTNHAPVYTQLRYSTRSEPPAPFDELAKDPIPVLEAILVSMEGYNHVWQNVKADNISLNSQWEKIYGCEFDKDWANYRQEIIRFKAGLDILRAESDILKAFMLTNETFRRGTKTHWRLFQIVFLVCEIPGITAISHPTPIGIKDREKVDIIYFPTGGGKTEAYLATIIFSCFYDRIRGKSAGVTAWTRFPLRLLTLQQTQRVADVIGLAELVRQEQTDSRLSGEGVDGFAVGYFVGLGGSPNEIINPSEYPYAKSEDQYRWSQANDINERQKWKRITHCPSCKTESVIVDFDVEKCSIVHRCTQPNCRFDKGELPIYVVDNDIYRYLPCVIVGTIDKLAGIGNQRKLSLILGQVDGKCSIHGYYNKKCCQKGCNDNHRLNKIIPKGLSGPTLFVQDELHLLKEGLGTFDGHYETFTQELLSFFKQDDLKIIASSATIEAFERQVSHLYGKKEIDARVFPGLGPTLHQSFYAETLSYPQRLYVGIIPHNKTIFNSILELVEYYHTAIKNISELTLGAPNPYGGMIAPGTKDWANLLDYYTTSMSYFLAGRDLNSFRTDLEGDVLPKLERKGLKNIDISELTGNTSTDEVSKTLTKLEHASNVHNIVLATSMVSHGVDIDRLNTMFFYGVPRQNAEYIQASSRVGRAHVGAVFMCHHPVRERDQSHYDYFSQYHQYLGRLVEPVAINRWSKFSIERTLPGLFMGVLLQVISNRSIYQSPNQLYRLDFIKREIDRNNITTNDFISILEDAYRVKNPVTPGEYAFKEKITDQVNRYFDYIRSSSSGEAFVSNVIIPKPMTSLRDVDEAITITVDDLN